MMPHLRRPLQMTNVRFDDYIESFSLSEKRDFIPKKYMTQKQIRLFRFGHPETQSNEAFVCIVSPKKKLSPNAPEFFLTIHSVQHEHSEFLFDLSKKDFDTDDDVSISAYEEGQASTSREFQCFDTNSESNSCSEDTSGCITEPSQSESDAETFYEDSYSNFSEVSRVSENNESYALEPESLHKESDIIFCGSEVTSDILNRVIAARKNITEVVICPDFQNLGLMIK